MSTIQQFDISMVEDKAIEKLKTEYSNLQANGWRASKKESLKGVTKERKTCADESPYYPNWNESEREPTFFHQVIENRLVSQPRDIIIDDHWRFTEASFALLQGSKDFVVSLNYWLMNERREG